MYAEPSILPDRAKNSKTWKFLQKRKRYPPHQLNDKVLSKEIRTETNHLTQRIWHSRIRERKLSHQMNDKLRIGVLIAKKDVVNQRPFLIQFENRGFGMFRVRDTPFLLELMLEFGPEDLAGNSREGVAVVAVVADEVADQAVEEDC